jgi:hypothetical protein
VSKELKLAPAYRRLVVPKAVYMPDAMGVNKENA